MLSITGINTFYGNTQALWDVTLNVKESEIVALVGSNGAGKTTLLKRISGLVKPHSGTIEFLGKRIDGLSPHSIVEAGISHIPEGGRIFTEMTVLENLEMGAYPYHAWKERKETKKQVYEIFPVLEEREKQMARTLSGGEHQMLAMGRGLMSRPKLCIFDEPSYGLAPKYVEEVFRIIESLHGQGITILLIEQNVRHSLEIADRAYVMENGRIVLEGACHELLETDQIRKAYLGL
ncbi:MAG: ABC transporter ATP-binding protein [Dehalococcoidales bacterium]|nr:MAG: ABC transporter ATP-binding protein [Dehalococcoidales bacterium]